MKIVLPPLNDDQISRLKRTPFSVAYDPLKQRYVYEVIHHGIEHFIPQVYLKRIDPLYNQLQVLKAMKTHRLGLHNLWIATTDYPTFLDMCKHYESVFDVTVTTADGGYHIDVNLTPKWSKKIDHEGVYKLLCFLCATYGLDYQSQFQGVIHLETSSFKGLIPSFLTYMGTEKAVSYYTNFWSNLNDQEPVYEPVYTENGYYSLLSVFKALGFREYNMLHIGRCTTGTPLLNPLNESYSTYCPTPLRCILQTKTVYNGYTKIGSYFYFWWRNKGISYRTIVKKALENNESIVYDQKYEKGSLKCNVLRHHGVPVGKHVECKRWSIIKLNYSLIK